MDWWQWLAAGAMIGVVLGGAVGFVMAALLAAAGRSSDGDN
jgi:hypothetical protein